MDDQPQKIDLHLMQLVFSLQAGAMQQLGKVVSPVTGKIERDLELARHTIDIIDMLNTKMKGNLTEEEEKFLGHVLYELRLNYVDETENKDFDRNRGYTEDISVRRPWRKRGLARSLLVQSIRMFQEMGMEETSLGVFVDNPSGALRLYESVGYETLHRYMAYRKSL